MNNSEIFTPAYVKSRIEGLRSEIAASESPNYEIAYRRLDALLRAMLEDAEAN